MGNLTRVVRIRRRVVDPEQLAGRRIMVEPGHALRPGSSASVDVLISREVPPSARAALETCVFRQMLRRLAANDCAPDSRSFPVTA